MPSKKSLVDKVKPYLVAVILTLFASNFAHAQESKEIHYPRLDQKLDPNASYIAELLDLMLEQSPKHYELVFTKGRTQQERAIYEMTKANGTVDLMWTMTTDEREKQLIPIRIPIDKGLIGWRVALITAKTKAGFSTIRTVDDLRAYSAGQGQNWPDVGILRANQLTVVTANMYDPLFSMLEAGRFDYFPRSIFELWSDLDAHKENMLEVDQNLVLQYPSACYFFVSPRRPELAKNLSLALEKIIANGSFEKLFRKHNQTSIDRAKLKQRTIIRLKNPLLDIKSMPLHRTELWFQPNSMSEN